MNRITVLIVGILLMLTQVLTGQDKYNIEVLSNTDLGEEGNDIWGYVDEDGREYAIMGARSTTRIFDVSDPENPVQLASISGAASIWRDIKSFKDHLYVTCDTGSDGLLIVDMSKAPDTITHKFWQPDLEVAGQSTRLRKCHNLYIDTLTGHVYLSGCNIGNEGVLILDINEDLDEPIHVGTVNRTYSHDAYVNKGILFSSDINIGECSIYDVSDPSDPVFVNSMTTSTFFTHNAWSNDDATYLFTTDEKPYGKIDAFDVSDLQDIKFLTSWEPEATKNVGVIPHNTHYMDGFLYTSWYTEGVRVTDVNDPSNIVEVGYYDPVDNFTNGFHGAWGAYPWLPSGNLLVSDIEDGLYVLKVGDNEGKAGPQRASYLRGNVTDTNTGENIPNATVRIQVPQGNNSRTNATGSYKTGTVFSGDYQVVFSHPNYDADTVWTTLVPGEYAVLDVSLGNTSTTVTVEDVDADKVGGALGVLINTATGAKSEVEADENGNFDLRFASNGAYELQVAKWGYKPTVISFSADSLVNTVVLEKGYQDDFFNDLGWENIGNAVTGDWALDTPVEVIFNGQRLLTDGDLDDDIGDRCLVTQVNVGSLGQDDIDDGRAILLSPKMDFSGNKGARINLSYFYIFLESDDPFDDAFTVKLINDVDEVELISTSEATVDWTDIEVIVNDTDIAFNDKMQLIIQATDIGNPHFTEAQVDGLKIELSETGFSGVGDITAIDLKVYPNPVVDNLKIKINEDFTVDLRYNIHDQSGKLVASGELSTDMIGVEHLENGVYTLQLINEKGDQKGKINFVKM